MKAAFALKTTFRSPFSFALNTLRQWRSPDVKVFLIGFNKCGTKAFHRLLNRNGVRSAHYSPDGKNLAREIEERLPDNTALKAFLDQWTAYSDLSYLSKDKLIEGNRHFRLYHELFPKAYFILNDRDVEAWLLSRKNKGHPNGFLSDSMHAMNCDADRTIQIWRETYAEHVAQVTNYFQGSPRFLHYRIDRDPIADVISFLSPSFSISERHWQVVNRTKREPEGANKPGLPTQSGAFSGMGSRVVRMTKMALNNSCG